MPTRLIRDGILDSQVLSNLNDDGAECLYWRLIVASDDYGRLDGRLMDSRCYPVKAVDPGELERRLQVLGRAIRDDGTPLVQIYLVGGRRFLHVLKHGQRNRGKSKCPPPPPITPAALELPAESHGEPPPSLGSAQQPALPGVSPPPDPAVQKRAEVRVIARDAVEYLNAKANTAYRMVDGTLQHPIARINEGATLDDLKAVVDAKVIQVQKGEFDAKYLRPETLFGREKFASYIGQIAMTPVKVNGAEKPPMILVRAWAADPERSIQLTEYPMIGEPKAEMVAKRAASEFGRMISARGLKTISVLLPGQAAALFSIGELKA